MKCNPFPRGRLVLAGLAFLGQLAFAGAVEVPLNFANLADHAFSATSHPGYVSRARLTVLETKLAELENDPRLTDVAGLQKTAADLAEAYLRMKSPNEAIWALRRAELHDDASYLEARLAALLSGDTGRVSGRARGRNRSTIYSYGPGLRSKGKTRNGPNSFSEPRLEIFAFHLDRLLNMNRVPVTVFKMFGEIQAYSIQAWIENSRGAGVPYMTRVSNGYEGRLPNSDELYPFDFITSQIDRVEDNALRTGVGRIFIPDNESMFAKPGDFLTDAFLPPSIDLFLKGGGEINARLLHRLHTLREADLVPLYTYLRDDEAGSMRRKIRQLRLAFPKPTFARLDNPRPSGKRFNDYLFELQQERKKKPFLLQGIEGCLRALGA